MVKRSSTIRRRISKVIIQPERSMESNNFIPHILNFISF